MARTTAEVKVLREAYSATWEAHDPERIAALHTEDTVFHTHIGVPEVHGRDALIVACTAIFATYKNFRADVHRALYGESHWVLDWSLHASIVMPQDGVEVERDITVDCVDVVVLSDDGLVARKDTYMDAAQLNAAMAAS